MDRDAGQSDRGDEARQGDTGMIGSETEEPGPGRDTSLTEPDPAAAGTDQPRGTVAMSEGDPMRTRLGSHVEGAGVIGYDVAAAEEGATQQAPAEDRPGYEPERTADPGLGATAAGAGAVGGATTVGAAGPGVAGDRVDDLRPTDRSVFADEPPRAGAAGDEGEPGGAGLAGFDDQSGGSRVAGFEGEPGGAGLAGFEGEPGGAGMTDVQGEPGRDLPATYTGEETDVAGRPEYADRTEQLGDQPLYEEEPQRIDRPGGGGSLLGDEEDRLDRPGPQGEPGVDQGVYDQEVDRARRERPSDGI
jgi:hypothetical protein